MKKIKIGVSSIYRIFNYGSTLQAAALQYVVRSLGYSCWHIRYLRHNVSFKAGWPRLFARMMFDQIRVFYNPQLRMMNRFRRFWRTHIQETALCCEPLDGDYICSLFDAFVCGSDQIWAPNQFNPYYFLDFEKRTGKRVAYAPSIGLPGIPADLRNEYARLISAIPNLSVRGDEDAKLLEEQFGIKAQPVLDPTLLLSADDWLGFARKSRVFRGDYVFGYFLGDTASHRKAFSDFAKRKKLPSIAVAKHGSDADWRGVIMRNDLGPSEWLRAIIDAKYVVTDSYHGMLFSIVFRKAFYELLRFSNDDPLCQNSRVFSVADKFGLRDRVEPFGSDCITEREDIDYGKVFSRLEKEISASVDFLQRSLKNAIGVES